MNFGIFIFSDCQTLTPICPDDLSDAGSEASQITLDSQDEDSMTMGSFVKIDKEKQIQEVSLATKRISNFSTWPSLLGADQLKSRRAFPKTPHKIQIYTKLT